MMSGDRNRKTLSPFPESKHLPADGNIKRSSGGTKKQTFGKPEDANLFRICAKVLNKIGEDVTPKPLNELLQKKFGPVAQAGDTGSSNQMSSEYLISQGSFMQSSFSIFGGHGRSSVSHTQMTQSGSFFDEIYDQTFDPSLFPIAVERKAEYDKVKLAVTEADLKAPVEVFLKETETVWLVDIAGDTTSSEVEDADNIRKSNETYLELLKNRPGNDRYIVKGMGTMSVPLKSKGVQASNSTYANKSVGASWSNIYDTNGPFLGKEEAGAESLTAEMTQLIEQQLAKAEEDVARDSMVLEATEKELDEDPSSLKALADPHRKTVIAEDGGSVVSVTEVQADAGPIKAATDDTKILQSESFKKSLFMMERVINLNTYHKTLTSYRGLPWISEEPAEQVDKNLPENVNLDLGPSLNRLWTYRCSVTKGHNVSCLSFNRANPDLLAVGYCHCENTKQKPGIVCCWSVKNPEFPERIYHTKIGVTAVSFSLQQPCLLAVGLRDGVIAIYNVATSSKESVLDTLYGVPARHIGPVWDLQWILRNRGTEGEENSNNEMLMSISLDGLVKQWAIRQGFECKDMLKLKYLPAKPASEKKGKRGADIVTSKYDGGFCFDFSPFDSDMYLVGSEDGYIHRCSCLYTEQSLDTYVGHSGPVYKVRWSPFDENVFISCSGDWSVRLWHQNRTFPVLTIPSTKAVPDICWSPRNSTVVAFVNEGDIEIWDLSQNILDPVIVTETSTQDMKLSAVAFAMNSDCLLVGDCEGQVTIYQLPEMLLHRDDPVLALQNVIKLALQSQYKE